MGPGATATHQASDVPTYRGATRAAMTYRGATRAAMMGRREQGSLDPSYTYL